MVEVFNGEVFSVRKCPFQGPVRYEDPRVMTVTFSLVLQLQYRKGYTPRGLVLEMFRRYIKISFLFFLVLNTSVHVIFSYFN